jgi:hypothetical protein
MTQFNVSMPALAYYEFTVEAESAADALDKILDGKFDEPAEFSGGESASCHTRVATPVSMNEFGKDDFRSWYWPIVTNLDTGEDFDVEADEELRDLIEPSIFEVKTWPRKED